MNSRPVFRFQKFAIADERCGMKIGTDAVLLGAWADVRSCQRIADIGTGCGLIAMMLAQRAQSAVIDAFDCEVEAAEQACQNVTQCPWPDRISVTHQSLSKFAVKSKWQQYDSCVCNPPFFHGSSPSHEAKKRLARHRRDLTLEHLFGTVAKLLNSNGRLSIVLPCTERVAVGHVGTAAGFFLVRQTDVRPVVGGPIKRILLEFSRQPNRLQHDELSIRNKNKEFTSDYASLTRHFHPRFADV